jgi:hypothetical protein
MLLPLIGLNFHSFYILSKYFFVALFYKGIYLQIVGHTGHIERGDESM